MSKEISRPTYLKAIDPYIGKDLIKVFTGQRRVGKSSLMRLVMDKIYLTNPTAHQIFIDMEDYQFSNLKSDRDLYAFVETQKRVGQNILFVDEIQEIEHFEKAIRSLNATGQFDIYLTGSNAHLLSKELSTLLAGRSVEIEVHGLVFPEFLEFHQMSHSLDSLKSYLK